MSLHEATNVEPLVKRVVVPVVPERAFAVFTADMSAWWPLAAFSVGGADARRINFGTAVGERIVEHGDDGPIALWEGSPGGSRRTWSRSPGIRVTSRRRRRASP